MPMQPLIRVQESLQASDAKRHIAHSFVVPPNTRAIKVRLTHTPGPADMTNMLTLTVLDPRGFRGEGHRMGVPSDGSLIHEVVIGEATATPGFIAGELSAGEWTAIINTHRIDDAAPCDYRLEINTGDTNDTNDTSIASGDANYTDTSPRWFRGDLHAHTIHSDGHWDVSGLLAWARSQRLDFATLSDHNTISPQREMLASSSPVAVRIASRIVS